MRNVRRIQLLTVLRRRADFVLDVPLWVPVVAVLSAAAVYIAVAWSATYPVLELDEVVMTGNSRVIAGTESTWVLGGNGFMPGLAVLMAPMWWLSDDPATVYRAGIWIAAAAALVAIYPLGRLAQHAGAPFRTALTMAAVVSLAPARALVSNYLLAESLLLLTSAALLVAVLNLLRHESWGWAGITGLLVGAVCISHGRGVAVALAFGVWSVFVLRTLKWKSVVAGGVALLSSVFAYVLYVVVSSQLLIADERIEATVEVSSGSSPSDYLAGIVGQLWYATLAWPAVVVAGVLWASRRFGADKLALLVILVAVLTIALSVVSLDPGGTPLRPDTWFYGRYMDHIWTVFAVLGIAVLVRTRWLAYSALVVLLTGAVGLAMVWFTAPKIPVDGLWGDLHVLGVSPWLSIERWIAGEPQDWTYLATLATGLAAIVCVLAWVRWVVVPILAALWGGLTLAHDQVLDIRDGERNADGAAPGIEYVPADTVLGIDERLGQQRNRIVFGSGSHETRPVDLADMGASGTELAYGYFVSEEPVESGAAVMTPTMNSTIVAWIYPGQLFDELEARQLLSEPLDPEVLNDAVDDFEVGRGSDVRP